MIQLYLYFIYLICISDYYLFYTKAIKYFNNYIHYILSDFILVSIPYYVYLKCVCNVLKVNSLFTVYFERDVILFRLLNPSFYSRYISYHNFII